MYLSGQEMIDMLERKRKKWKQLRYKEKLKGMQKRLQHEREKEEKASRRRSKRQLKKKEQEEEEEEEEEREGGQGEEK